MSRSICTRCTRPLPECFCHLLLPLSNRWPVWILQHALEAAHPLNTARIAQLCLQQCTTLTTHADVTAPLPPQPLLQNAVLIFPGEGSRPIEELPLAEPVPLIFIDATWRKSRRMLAEQRWLGELPRYRVEAPEPSRYRIRKEPRPGYLSTLETIVEVLTARETVPVRDMLAIMDWIIDRQIAAMGEATWKRNYRG